MLLQRQLSRSSSCCAYIPARCDDCNRKSLQHRPLWDCSLRLSEILEIVFKPQGRRKQSQSTQLLATLAVSAWAHPFQPPLPRQDQSTAITNSKHRAWNIRASGAAESFTAEARWCSHLGTHTKVNGSRTRCTVTARILWLAVTG